MGQPVDAVGAWFPVLEKLGLDVRIAFGRLRYGTGDVEWTYLPHQDFDGIGGFAHLLRAEGLPAAPLPSGREEKAPSALRQLWLSLLHSWDARVRQVSWKRFDWSARGPAAGLAWHALSVEETARLRERAERLEVSVNTLLLWTLDRAVRALWLAEEPRGGRRWLIPVNLRGAVRLSRDTANHASFIAALARGDATPAEIHASVRASARRLSHWGAWWWLGISRWIGEGGMLRLMEYYEKRRHSWMGSFSNIGEWNAGSGTGDVRFFCPPASRSHPVASGAVTWNGRVALSVQLHPGLSPGPEGARATMDAWSRELAALISE
jgi:hypothetical protein